MSDKFLNPGSDEENDFLDEIIEESAARNPQFPDLLRQARLNREIPPPKCKLGYPEDQLREILGDRYGEFMHWMSGQTMTICDGWLYDHDKREYYPTHCGPHGPVVYDVDLERFIEFRI